MEYYSMLKIIATGFLLEVKPSKVGKVGIGNHQYIFINDLNK